MKTTITVQQLLDALNKVEDKSKNVFYGNDDSLDYCSVNGIEEYDEEIFLVGECYFSGLAD